MGRAARRPQGHLELMRRPAQTGAQGPTAGAQGLWSDLALMMRAHPFCIFPFARHPSHCLLVFNTTQHNTTQHNTTQHNTTQHNTTQHNTTQHNTTQHNTTQHNTTQHNTTQHNTTQHRTRCGTTRHNRMQHDTTQQHTAPHRTTPHYTTLHYTTPHQPSPSVFSLPFRAHTIVMVITTLLSLLNSLHAPTVPPSPPCTLWCGHKRCCRSFSLTCASQYPLAMGSQYLSHTRAPSLPMRTGCHRGWKEPTKADDKRTGRSCFYTKGRAGPPTYHRGRSFLRSPSAIHRHSERRQNMLLQNTH